MEYLAPVLRNHFNLFYRFGYTYIPQSVFIEIKNDLTEDIKRELVWKFESLCPYEYDEEYLILKIQNKVNSQSDNLFIKIQDVLAIYPLSAQAKISIEGKIDSRIKLEEPIFESYLNDIEASIERREIQQGIDAVWQILKLEGSSADIQHNIKLDSLLEGRNLRKKGIKAANVERSSYWTYLMAYERYEYFPKETLGYFYDAGEIFSYFKGKTDGIVGTKIFEVLESIKHANSEANFNLIVSELERHPLSHKYIDDASSDGIRNYIVTPLFLRWKDELRNGEVDLLNSTLLNKKTGEISFYRQYPNEVKAAILLLAVFFGFKRFYDDYYNSLNLQFFKSSKNSPVRKVELENPQNDFDEIIEHTTEGMQAATVMSEEKVMPRTENTTNLQDPMASVYKSENESEAIVPDMDENELQDIANNDYSLEEDIINILKVKNDTTLADLSKDLTTLKKIKLKVKELEVIIKAIPGLEGYKEKNTQRVKLIQQLSIDHG